MNKNKQNQGIKMNKLQEIVFEISGYNGLAEAGARSDTYYEYENDADKWRFIEDIASYMNLKIRRDETYEIQEFLDKEFLCQDEKYQEFEVLS